MPIMPTPRVSVIIPVYNGAVDLPAAVDSALCQHNCEVEVVVVNDGSTDETAKVMDGYGDRIVAVHQKNLGAGGLSRTRNNGVAGVAAAQRAAQPKPPPPPSPTAILSFDFDGTLHHSASDPPVPVEFFEVIRKQCWKEISFKRC